MSETPAPRAPRAPRRRRPARRRVRPQTVVTAGVFAVAGLLFATSAEIARGTDLRASARGDLAEVIRAQEARVERRAAEVSELREQVRRLTEEQAGGSAAVALASAQADDLRRLAGLTPVEGPALRVTLDDSPLELGDLSLDPDTRPDDLVVHQQDLQAVVNALWAGGAEAVQLMDQRVISTSAVRCVGPVLILQGRVYPPPYVVTAIGPRERMRAALDSSPAVLRYRDYVDLVGLRYDVEELDAARVPGFEGPLDVRHAEVPTT